MLARLVLAAVCLAGPALANDSIAELGTGGLILGRTDAIFMQSEDLFISMDEVRVDYVFSNQTDKDVATVVAFPMPDIAANPYTMPALPDNTSDNFLGFQVQAAGKPIQPTLEQRAVAVGLDITDELARVGVPTNPFVPSTIAALEKLSDRVAADWVDRGLIFIDRYDDGSGWKSVRTPLWTLKSTYWWESVFSAGAEVKVAHQYRPSLGASAGLSFFYDGKFQGPYAEYKSRYCIDETFERAVRKAAQQGPDGYPQLQEFRLQYVLTTGGNWALGNIGKFHLTVDKGDAANIVSFCGSGVKKTGPTTFEMTEEMFYPARDLDILILKPYELEPTSIKRPHGGVSGRMADRPKAGPKE